MARPKKNEDERLSRCFYTRLTERNLKLLELASERKGLRVSEFLNLFIKENLKIRLPRK